MKVSKWGNSEVVEALGLREGDDVTLLVAGNPALEIAKTPGAHGTPGSAASVPQPSVEGFQVQPLGSK